MTPDLFDPAVNACPYHAYTQMRDELPVWQDPRTHMFVLTRAEDVRAALLDTERFSNEVGSAATRRELALRSQEGTARASRLRDLYEQKGWMPAPNLDALDAPKHMEQRRVFQHAFRPAVIARLDPLVERVAGDLIDGFLAAGRCEWVEDFAVPFPLTVIGRQVGVPDEDLTKIKRWTDAFVQRMSLQQTEDELLACVELELEAQHYFQAHIDRLRAQPDDTLFSTIVNTVVPEWGRPLTDEELHGELMSDVFVGGAETTTNALSAGVRILTERPDLWTRLKTDPSLIDAFSEEVLRVESPVQSLIRKAAVDIDLHGVTIPEGAIVNLRYGAANRDERAYERPDEIDLDRPRPRGHLAFGTGAHHCLGAPLARRELYLGFRALLERVDSIWQPADAPAPGYRQNYFLRGMTRLDVEFTPTSRSERAAPAPEPTPTWT
jgi:cytochrome P450